MRNIGSLSGKGGEVCEELRKRMIDVCCLQEARWRGHGARVLEINGMIYKFWWSGKGDGVVGDLVKELCEMMEVRMVSDKVMAVVLVLKMC